MVQPCLSVSLAIAVKLGEMGGEQRKINHEIDSSEIGLGTNSMWMCLAARSTGNWVTLATLHLPVKCGADRYRFTRMKSHGEVGEIVCRDSSVTCEVNRLHVYSPRHHVNGFVPSSVYSKSWMVILLLALVDFDG